MALKINSSGVSKARSLIKAGKINTGTGWGFDSSDRNKLLDSVNGDWSQYAKWFLVIDNEMDEDTFGRYKYPYGKNGEIWRRAVIAIKSRAAQNNWNELADTADSLLQAIDKKESKSARSEYRVLDVAELRADEDKKIQGYAAVFNKMSEDLGGFREIIRHGAFSKTINDGADVRALLNHDTNYVLGRTTNGTLVLEEDKKGLKVDITPPDTQWARDLVVSINRGDINQMSFGFSVVTDKWRTKDEENIRELLEVKLFDVSPVTYPAYPQTNVQVRDLFSGIGLDYDGLRNIIIRADHGLPLIDDDYELINTSIEILQRLVPEYEPVKDDHSYKGPDAVCTTLKQLELELLKSNIGV